MSIQWTFIAGYLYFEIAIVTVMILPVASPRRWNKFFNSRLFSLFRDHAAVYFYVLLGVLCLFLVDAVREMRKYSSNTEHSGHGNLAAEMKSSVKLFRSQRNFYITGFAIFLALVIRRLVSMLIIQAELLEKSANIVKKADSTTKMAQKISSDDEKQLDSLTTELLTAKGLLDEYERKNKSLEYELNVCKKKYEALEKKLAAGDSGNDE